MSTAAPVDVERLLANTPERLRERPQWVCWKYIQRAGKATKCPVNACTGAPADSTDPSTWVSFDEAVAACRDRQRYAGVGFVFAADDPFAGVDLDGCIDADGGIVDSAREIIDSLNSYTEVSPSGQGVKVFIEGKKPQWAQCKSKRIGGFKETEVYDQKRFFTVTGDRLANTPPETFERQPQLESLCRRLWPAREKPAPRPVPIQERSTPDDDALLDRMFASKPGEAVRRLWEGDTSAYDGDDSAADLALCNHLAFWTGRDTERMDRLFRRSALYRTKWERSDYRGWTLDRAVDDCREVYRGAEKPNGRQRCSATVRKPSISGDDKPTIHIDVDEHRVIAESVAALNADGDLYQRGNVLVRVLREQPANDGVIRPEGSATIVQVPAANLRERLTRHAHFTRNGPKNRTVAAHPPLWLVAGVEARGEWPGIRHLMGTSDAPILRADGSVWQRPGYDPKTGVLFEPTRGIEFPPIPPDVGPTHADAARDVLLEIVCDFPFESDEHRAAWLAALLTPLARFAFAGPSPLFLIDANVRGAGKGLLAQTVGRIVLGREMPVSSYSHDSEEMRKKITAIAIGGDRMILLDNLEGSFGNDALDRALTSTRWKDRLLGKSQEIELPLIPVWFATGNNVQVAADTMRRIIHIRLDCLTERPEERSGFRRENLLAWIDAKRATLLSAALTILSAYLRSGRPVNDLGPFGSFEGWSSVVRAAVVWVGQPDPCLTRTKLAESADTSADAFSQLVAAWKGYERSADGVVVSEMLAALYPQHGKPVPSDGASVAMRAAIENLVGCSPGKAPTTRQVGNKLRKLRRRVIGGVYLDSNPNEYNRAGAVWRLRHVEPDD